MIGNNLDKSLSYSPEKSVNETGLSMTCFCLWRPHTIWTRHNFKWICEWPGRWGMIYASVLTADASCWALHSEATFTSLSRNERRWCVAVSTFKNALKAVSWERCTVFFSKHTSYYNAVLKSGGSLRSVGFIHWGAWMSVKKNSTTIH